MIKRINEVFENLSYTLDNIIPKVVSQVGFKDKNLHLVLPILTRHLHNLALDIEATEKSVLREVLDIAECDEAAAPICLGGFTPFDGPTSPLPEITEPATDGLEDVALPTPPADKPNQKLKPGVILTPAPTQELPLAAKVAVELVMSAPKKKQNIPRKKRVSKAYLDKLDSADFLKLGEAVILTFHRFATPVGIALIPLNSPTVIVRGDTTKELYTNALQAIIDEYKPEITDLAKERSFPSLYLKPRFGPHKEDSYKGIYFAVNASIDTTLRRLEYILEKIGAPTHTHKVYFRVNPPVASEEPFVTKGSHNNLLSLKSAAARLRFIKVDGDRVEAHSITEAYYTFVMACHNKVGRRKLEFHLSPALRSEETPDRQLFAHERGVLPHEVEPFKGFCFNAVPSLAALKEFMKITSKKLGIKSELIID